MPKCKMRSWRGRLVHLAVRQLGCKANTLQECGLCCSSHSSLAFEVKKQSGSWREASSLAVWAGTKRLPNSP